MPLCLPDRGSQGSVTKGTVPYAVFGTERT